MSLKRRLFSLECRPFLRPTRKPDVTMERRIQKQLALPLPEDATNAERAECLRLLVDAQARTRINRKDASGLDAVRDYALKLHAKYGTEPFWADS
jgi:hypothetical protein